MKICMFSTESNLSLISVIRFYDISGDVKTFIFNIINDASNNF